ncbi:diphthine--ammonia ligase [Nanoarchaeota archaeon]
MKVAVLFSGGKDSSYALFKAKDVHEPVVLISMLSENKESYMFQTANVSITKFQAEAIGLPIIQKSTKGEKEDELEDLKIALEEAKEKYKIEGVVTGALGSVYQASRVQRICNDLKLWCFNPIWLKNQINLLNELIENNFKVVISGVFAFPLEANHLGRIIDKEFVEEMKMLHEKHQINPAGEGGEIESTVLDAPFFKKKIEIVESEVKFDNHAGTFNIKEAVLAAK